MEQSDKGFLLGLEIAKNVAENGRLIVLVTFAVNLVAGFQVMALLCVVPLFLAMVSDLLPSRRSIASVAVWLVTAALVLLTLVNVW